MGTNTPIPTEVLFDAIKARRGVWGQSLREKLCREVSQWAYQNATFRHRWMNLGTCILDAYGWKSCATGDDFSRPDKWRRFDDELEAMAFSLGVDVDSMRDLQSSAAAPTMPSVVIETPVPHWGGPMDDLTAEAAKLLAEREDARIVAGLASAGTIPA